jgi:hypothetical protein
MLKNAPISSVTCVISSHLTHDAHWQRQEDDAYLGQHRARARRRLSTSATAGEADEQDASFGHQDRATADQSTRGPGRRRRRPTRTTRSRHRRRPMTTTRRRRSPQTTLVLTQRSPRPCMLPASFIVSNSPVVLSRLSKRWNSSTTLHLCRRGSGRRRRHLARTISMPFSTFCVHVYVSLRISVFACFSAL